MAAGYIAIIWKGPGVWKDGGTVVAYPGEKVRTDSATAERWVQEGKAVYAKG